MTQALNLSQYLVVLFDPVASHVAHIIAHNFDTIVEKRDGRVLGAQVFANRRLHHVGSRRVARVLGNVIDADAFGLVGGQRVLELDEENARLLVDEIDHRLVNRHGQVGVLAERI